MTKGKIIAGIDIGSSKTTSVIAQIAEEGGLQVMGVASITSPPDGIRKGQIVDIEKAAGVVVATVEKAERMAGFAIDNVVAIINGGHIQGQNSHGVVAVSSPNGEIEHGDVERVIDAARAISLPAGREIIHVLPSQFIVDGEGGIKDPVGMSGVRMEVDAHIVTASTTAVRNLNKCINEVGANITGVIFSALASSVAVLSDTERELGVILVDIGAGTTSMAVFIEGALAHSRVLPIGAKNITNDLAIGLRTSLEEAEKIKLMLSVGKKEKGKDKEADQIDLGDEIEGEEKSVSRKTLTEGIIKPRLNEIFTMIALELKSSGVAGRTPSGVVLTGGGALTVGAVESARRILALPTRVGYPMGVSGIIDDISSPAFAAIVGGILWSSRSLSPASAFDLSSFTNPFGSLHVRGIVGKMVEVVKGLLP